MLSDLYNKIIYNSDIDNMHFLDRYLGISNLRSNLTMIWGILQKEKENKEDKLVRYPYICNKADDNKNEFIFKWNILDSNYTTKISRDRNGVIAYFETCCEKECPYGVEIKSFVLSADPDSMVNSEIFIFCDYKDRMQEMELDENDIVCSKFLEEFYTRTENYIAMRERAEEDKIKNNKIDFKVGDLVYIKTEPKKVYEIIEIYDALTGAKADLKLISMPIIEMQNTTIAGLDKLKDSKKYVKLSECVKMEKRCN